VVSSHRSRFATWEWASRNLGPPVSFISKRIYAYAVQNQYCRIAMSAIRTYLPYRVSRPMRGQTRKNALYMYLHSKQTGSRHACAQRGTVRASRADRVASLPHSVIHHVTCTCLPTALGRPKTRACCPISRDS